MGSAVDMLAWQRDHAVFAQAAAKNAAGRAKRQVYHWRIVSRQRRRNIPLNMIKLLL